jgi:hypothetical protein
MLGHPADPDNVTDLERSHAELRAAWLGEIRKLNFGRADKPTLAVLRRALRDARVVAKTQSFGVCVRLG